MQNTNNEFAKAIKMIMTNATVKVNPEDYKNENGLWVCGKCHKPKEGFTLLFDEKIKVPFTCDCEKAEYERKSEERIQRNNDFRREKSFSGLKKTEFTFENDNGDNPNVTALCKKYVENFDEFRREGEGLLFYGTTGSGKTFHACCIANALIDKGYRVYQTNFIEIEERIKRGYSDYSYASIARENELVIIDDLGAERNSEYINSIVYNVINALCENNTSFIITTNLSIGEITDASNESLWRVYERILAKCEPIEVKTAYGSRRIQGLQEARERRKKLLGL